MKAFYAYEKNLYRKEAYLIPAQLAHKPILHYPATEIYHIIASRMRRVPQVQGRT